MDPYRTIPNLDYTKDCEKMEIERDDVNEDDSFLITNFTLRNYQSQTLEEARQRNSIVFLPTGSGKTLISIHLLLSKTRELVLPYSQGGKRAFFVQNTKVLVHQTGRVLRAYTKFKVQCITGDMNVDKWDMNVWLENFEKYHVLVLTAEILRIILELQYIKPFNISVVIFDECHHAVHNHPYRKVAESLTKENPSGNPLIFGLSSVLFLSKISSNQVLKNLKILENTYKAKIISNSDFEEVIKHCSCPEEKIVLYKSSPDWHFFQEVINIYDEALTLMEKVNILPQDTPVVPDEAVVFKNQNKVNQFRNMLRNAKLLLEDLGPFCGSIAALFYILQVETKRISCLDPTLIEFLVYVRTVFNKVRRILLKHMGEEENSSVLLKYSTDKIQNLVSIIKENFTKSKNQSSFLVFAEQKITSIVLAIFLKRLSLSEEFSFIKADFAVSSSMLSSSNLIIKDKMEKVIKKFLCREINILVATNILEEGVDISSCNVVISLEFPNLYSKYYQIRGRARDKSSLYYIFINEMNHSRSISFLNEYKDIAAETHKAVSFGLDEEEIDQEKSSEVNFLQTSKKLLEITGETAIAYINKYCSSLPQDKFCYLSPNSWYTKTNSGKKGFLQLPTSSPLRETIEGDVKKSKKSAKKSVFFNVLKRLYEIDELDDDLNVKNKVLKDKSYDYLFPNFINENVKKLNPNQRIQTYSLKFPEVLSHCLPLPNVKTYLHVIKFTTASEKPQLDRREAIYNLFQNSSTYAILSAKPLPQICSFSLFMNIIQIDCELLCNCEELTLTDSELEDIKLFHIALFKKIIRIQNNIQVFDKRNKQSSFFIVPVELNENNNYVLNWDVIRCDFCKHKTSAVVRYNPAFKKNKTEEKTNFQFFNQSSSTSLVPANEIDGKFFWELRRDGLQFEPKFLMSDTDYKHFIVSPSYRKCDPPQCYIVMKVCHDMTPLSEFPNEKNVNFLSYYKEKYGIHITNQNQPLLKVSPLPHCSNFNRPNPNLNRKPKRSRDRIKEYQEHFVPELCDVFPFINKFWIKTLLLPTVINRINHLYLVEEFRRKLVGDTGMGTVELPKGVKWRPLRSSFIEEDDDDDLPCGGPFNENNLNSSLPLTKLKEKTTVNKPNVLDPIRHMFEVGLCDIVHFVNCSAENAMDFENPKFSETLEENEKNLFLNRENVSVPQLKIFEKKRNTIGPELADLVQASTAKSANDIVNYERLEIFGDSFLKFSVSLFLFKSLKNHEGVLTSLKGKLIGNRNLFYCGLAKNIQDIINVIDFVPTLDWNPPLLHVPENFVNIILENDIDTAVIHRCDIPYEEQISGDVSQTTIKEMEAIIESYGKCYERGCSSMLGTTKMKDKIVSDCVEAFIGVYLESLGIPETFEFLIYMGILPKSGGSYANLMEKPYESVLFNSGTEKAVINLLSGIFYSDLENTLGYCFKNKSLLLEAVTHPSYSFNRITNSYQRLEFLGDAILDFLITSYIYENYRDISPGKLTDMRSALVNNVTFACLTVRYDLHKYLLSFSTSLTTAIDKFVNHQVSVDHQVNENVFILLEENDCLMAESVLVPKALGDIFESLAGAIFLDSGNSLETVWNVFYKLMHKEIKEFTTNTPKNSIRLLHEICNEKPYFECKVVGEDLVKVKCTVNYKNYEIVTHGFGKQKKEAKNSASKLALKKLLELKN